MSARACVAASAASGATEAWPWVFGSVVGDASALAGVAGAPLVSGAAAALSRGVGVEAGVGLLRFGSRGVGAWVVCSRTVPA